jgi:hypothetical protein
VRKAGYGFIEGHHVDETSLLVVGKSAGDGGALLGQLKYLGKKYCQDSILHRPYNSEKASLHRTNETEKHKHTEANLDFCFRVCSFVDVRLCHDAASQLRRDAPMRF